MNKKNILLLCKVVDNFGDIGTVYRLAKSLTCLCPELNLTLAVSNLKSFSLMADKIDPSKKIQNFIYKNTSWKILDWNLDESVLSEKEEALKTAGENQIILECFQCGRPEWLENILFSNDFTNLVQIINIDYLTAEEYADEFHLLRSGTRKTNIKKIFFMPGFTSKTGGLILPDNDDYKAAEASPAVQKILKEQKDFNILFFAYEKNCTPLVKAISSFQEKIQQINKDFSVCVYLAAGKSYKPFTDAYKEENCSFKTVSLPFLQQNEWDYLLNRTDFNFIRGEDSLSRAALSGTPYIWHAYIQDGDYQLVKVNALLERVKPFFNEADFKTLKSLCNSYNKNESASDEEHLLAELLFNTATERSIKDSFLTYSRELVKNGNLAARLLEYIETL